MSEFELVTGPTFTIEAHLLWLNRGWRITARSVYRTSRLLVSRDIAKGYAMSEVLEAHWYWKQRAELDPLNPLSPPSTP